MRSYIDSQHMLMLLYSSWNILLQYISFSLLKMVHFNKKLLNPSQTIRCLTFWTPSLTTHLIQKFVQNITSFVVAWFINKSSSRMT